MSSRTQEMIAWLVENGHTPEIKPEAIHRFIDGTMKDEYVRHEDALQVAALLVALMDGVRNGDNMNVQLRQILHLRKKSAGRYNFDPETAYPGSKAYDIVEQYVRGEIKRVEALEKLELEVIGNKSRFADNRQIERWIAVMKPRVEKDVERLEGIRESWEKFKKDISDIDDK